MTDSTLLARPPESFRPDRAAVIHTPGQRPAVELVPGVQMDCLAGKHNGARQLTTGVVSFAPCAQLPYHTHPFSESVTVLTGSALASVEGRQYRLGPFDNILIPRGCAHAVHNASDCEPARFHVAFPSDTPTREWVTTTFESRPMPQDSTGVAGKERITRLNNAARREASAGACFIDLFNQELVPGVEMSGGYGWFQPGARSPARFNDQDESICIVEGDAACFCEGRRYAMADYVTALQPRGRVHCLVNEGAKSMGMLWVNAAPKPARFQVEELYATAAGAAWPE